MYLISGSFAFDTILSHTNPFHARILPDEIARLNVAFGVDKIFQEFGGTGGNIAYNAALLGDSPVLVGALGYDFSEYVNKLESMGLVTDSLSIVKHLPTAHAWILTDSDNNQITAFHKGAMAQMPHVPSTTPDLWHIAPDSFDTMISMIDKALTSGKRYLFDPGQALPSFLEADANGSISLDLIIKNSTGLFVNDYECALIENHLDTTMPSLIWKEEQFIVITRGARGSDVLTSASDYEVGVAPCLEVVDPTGCGDAFRAGFLHKYCRGEPLVEAVKMGAALASFAIERTGGQNHSPSFSEIVARANSVNVSDVKS